MSRFIFILIISLTICPFLSSQSPDKEYFKNNLEVYFEFEIINRGELETLTRIISIDNVDKNKVHAYANEEEWNNFIKLGFRYTILPHPGDAEGIMMSDDMKSLGTWDVYPTYDAYIQMMYQFASLHPGICRIVDIGNTVNGRKLLFAVISDNVNVKEPEPQFMFTSTMHGDEATGYVLMLRLIDSLLTSYGDDPRITNLVNNIEIWINPNFNPDGTYYGGNNTVANARRYNANGIDLNRNFPTPAGSPSGPRQVETQAMVTLAEANNFALSANFHGGAEVVNYPWDSFSRLHPDNTWWVQISRKYADTAQANSPAGYLNDLNNGITNGYAWYAVYGGRQDFFTYFRRGREVTIEISGTKLPASSQLPLYWNYNRLSFLSYMENCLYGIRGVVSDSLGNPVKALISISGHDADSSEIYSDFRSGNYHRMLSPGTYSLTFTAPGFLPKTIHNITVTHNNTTIIDIQLSRDEVPVEFVSFNASAGNNFIMLTWETATETNNNGFEIDRRNSDDDLWQPIAFVKGNSTTSERKYYSYKDFPDLSGRYYYRLKQIDYDGTFTYSETIESEINIASFELYQNYPNPFNPSTIIRYSLASESKVKLDIYDMLGRRIRELIDSRQDSGMHEVSFNSERLTSGIYMVRLLVLLPDGNNIELNRKINFIK